MNSKQLRIRLIFENDEGLATNALRYLVGKKIKAYGKDSGNIYYDGSEQELEITHVHVGYIDDDDYGFFSLNIFPKGYDGETEKLYTDKKFLKALQKLMPGFDVDYSEAGMQGKDFANFDISFLPK